MTDVLKIFFSSEVENKIDEYLFKIKSTKFLSELNLDLNSSYISLMSYGLNDLENLKSIWLEIAHLSVNLYVEYEFFRQFSFPSRYESQIYEESLRKLGYKQHEGIWKINEIPNKQCIIENIFSSYICIFLFQEKQQELDNEKFIKQNSENSNKFAELCNENKKSAINNTQENIDIAISSNREMGNISNDFSQKFGRKVINGKIGICMDMPDFIINNPINTNRNDESLDTSINSNITLSNSLPCSNISSNLQNLYKEDQSIKMRSTSSKISNRPEIKSYILPYWTCNVCSYNQNTNDNINCKVCISSRFAKINSCAIESSYETSNENEIDSLEHVENIFNKDDVNLADNEDKWTCTQCTFSNKTTVGFCEICFTPNINKVGTVGDCELPEETWCCKRCGENNLFEHYKCKRCRLPAEFFNKWRCEQCSFYNDEVAICCGACEIRNPYLIKCNLCAKNLINKKHGKLCKQCSVFTERCRNNENLPYQDNRKAQSEIKNVLSKGHQRREKLNEHQINVNNNGSQNIERKDKVSTNDRKRNGDFRIYNIYKTPSEISESDNSPSKKDQNSGKLNKNQIKLNENIPENVEMKNKNSTVAATNKRNSKQCKNCKSESCYNNQYWCDKCENLKWFCENEACDGINFKNEHCKQCKAKKGSNFSNCMIFWMMKDVKEVNMWQCTFCLQFVDGTLLKCNKCLNLRDLPCYKKCKCNWNNLNIREKCDKCGACMIKIVAV